MRVLVACEYSGAVRDAFIAAGHDAMSCDLLPTDAPGPHYQGDVFDVIRNDWDLMVAHPPCTYLTLAGARWLYEDTTRWQHMIDAAVFFRRLLDAPIPRVAVENPIMHGWAAKIVGRRQAQVVQPWMFGHPERKGTALWLRGLSRLEPTDDVQAEMLALPLAEQHRLHRLSPSADRWKVRSATFPGLAKAMAEQWGGEDLLTLAGAA
jgi:hypothetical protein